MQARVNFLNEVDFGARRHPQRFVRLVQQHLGRMEQGNARRLEHSNVKIDDALSARSFVCKQDLERLDQPFVLHRQENGQEEVRRWKSARFSIKSTSYK